MPQAKCRNCGGWCVGDLCKDCHKVLMQSAGYRKTNPKKKEKEVGDGRSKNS